MEGGFAAGDLDDVGFAFVFDDGVEHEGDLFEGAVRGAMGAGLGVADGAGEIAVVGDFEEGEAGVLFVVGAEAAVVGAAVLDGGVEFEGHLPGLDEVALLAEVGDVGGDEDLLEFVGGAEFLQIDFAPPRFVLDEDFGFDLAEADGADGVGEFVEEVGAVGHEVAFLKCVEFRITGQVPGRQLIFAAGS